MTTEEFKKIYIQHGKNSMIAAIIGMIVCLGGGLTLLVLDFNIYLACGFIGLGLIASLGLYKNIQHKKDIQNGINPVLKGIESGNSDYIKWYYVSELVNEKDHNIRSYQFNAYSEKKIVLMFAMNGHKQAYEAMDLFTEKFPQAQKGYSEDIRKDMVARYKYKFHNQEYKGIEEK